MISAHLRRSNARLQSVQQGRHANLRLEHLLHLPGQLCRRSCQAAGTRSSSSVRRAATALDRRSLRLRHAAHPLAGRERGFGRRGIVAGGRGHGEGGRWVRSDGRARSRVVVEGWLEKGWQTGRCVRCRCPPQGQFSWTRWWWWAALLGVREAGVVRQ